LSIFELSIISGIKVLVYPKSVIKHDGVQLFIAKMDNEKFLFIVAPSKRNKIYQKFDGKREFDINNLFLKACPLVTKNRMIVQLFLPFTRPQLIGRQDSFGFGDRLGLANPGHLKALSGSHFMPILAQQSIREMIRTHRLPEEVMDAAVWAILQEGYQGGFGADADHLKTTEDIDQMVKAGFTMFTIDPGDFVDNQVDHLNLPELELKMDQIPWEGLDDSRDFLEKRYLDKKFRVAGDLILHPLKSDLYRALLKYGHALVHIQKMAMHLLLKYPQYPSEIEISVDETESVTSPFEHFFFANELKRLKVPFISLAPRFIGKFEKGIDYQGNTQLFSDEYIKHIKIAQFFGTYKLSLHSGSDKFIVYKIIGSLKQGYIHVKTAGTSYLEALKVLALKEPNLFRKILDFSRGIYETEKESYHVSATLSKVPAGNACSDQDLLNLFHDNNARQVLHVTFGRVLTAEKSDGAYLFRDDIINFLKIHESTYDQLLVEHFRRHLAPFDTE